jgi:hypothetical protein
MIDLDDNIPFDEEVGERLVVEEESIRVTKDRSARLEEQHRDGEDQSKERNELKISSVYIETQNILCDKHKSRGRVECQENKIHRSNKDWKDMHHVQLNIDDHTDWQDTNRTAISFFEVAIESSDDTGIRLNYNNLEAIVHLVRNNSLQWNSIDKDKCVLICCSSVDNTVHSDDTDSISMDSDEKIDRNEGLSQDEKQEDERSQEDISKSR